jgi:hypothetical protein
MLIKRSLNVLSLLFQDYNETETCKFFDISRHTSVAWDGGGCGEAVSIKLLWESWVPEINCQSEFAAEDTKRL